METKNLFPAAAPDNIDAGQQALFLMLLLHTSNGSADQEGGTLPEHFFSNDLNRTDLRQISVVATGIQMSL